MRCVYTVLLGGYEALTEQPIAHTSSFEFICLTDNPNLTSETWNVKLVAPVMPNDSVRSQRHLKIAGHPHLEKFSQTLYIDNNVLLTKNPEEIFEKYAGHAPLALPLHSFRNTVDDEFGEVTAHLLDDPEIIARQHKRYESLVPAVFAQKPHWTAILIRDHTSPELVPLMEMWRSEVAHYSRRDQLSVNACITLTRAEVFSYEIPNHESWFHQWQVAKNRREDVRFWKGGLPFKGTIGAKITRRARGVVRKLVNLGQK